MHGGYPCGQLQRNAAHGDEIAEEIRAAQNGETDNDGLGSGSQSLGKTLPGKAAQGQGKCQGGECADAAPFRGGKEPRIDAADGHHENKQNRQRHDQGFRFFRAGNGGAGGAEGGIAPYPVPDDQHEAEHAGDAGQYARHEQIADGLIGQHAVDDEGRAGRTERADGAGSRERAHGKGVVVAVAAHFRQGDGGHGHIAGDIVSDDRAEGRAGRHAAVREASAGVSHPGPETAEQILPELAVETQVAHEQEEHERRPVVTGHCGEPRLAEQIERAAGAAQGADEDEGRGHERVGDGHAHEEEGEHEYQPEDSHRNGLGERRAVHGEENAERKRDEGEAEHGAHAGGAVAFKGVRKSGQHVVQQRNHNERASGGRIQNEGQEMDMPGRRDQCGAFEGVVDHCLDAEHDNDKAPEIRGEAQTVFSRFRQAGGDDVHVDMRVVPLGVGYGAEKHHDHEQFGDFNGSADGSVDGGAQNHIKEGQGDHAQKDIHGNGAAERAERPETFKGRCGRAQNTRGGRGGIRRCMGTHRKFLSGLRPPPVQGEKSG